MTIIMALFAIFFGIVFLPEFGTTISEVVLDVMTTNGDAPMAEWIWEAFPVLLMIVWIGTWLWVIFRSLGRRRDIR